ncbi:tRNA pseudouridine(55) synthase TruB [Moraxella osloensis]|uniref:tRNA pseudouridine synthase B n=1 Tax=Faucicola osloensis TaxID=34062 RepID=A0AAD2JBH8_FAUOS|nr:tRNA pseudouridine(55) synthase TruB [Moraxella osloensis]ATW70623.1 tRNA pseudouridine(55) synthase TruB [Moraxella osloensis]ATY49324.1 tRNA pseudouridine(55) synthase TruB [Moraxella osloensis]
MMTQPKTKSIVSGVLLIDKPQGMTSQQVVSKVKYLLKSDVHDSKKAGHTGTLDPMATGLLPICLGEATKFSHYQLDAIKSYHAIIKLGEQTDTGDAEGEIIATSPVPHVTQAMLQSVTEQFLGEIMQVPPMYSALKKDGKKLYELAREGIEVERAARPLIIYELSLTPLSDQQLQLTVTCSKGTYVRVLAEDIAKALGTLGHLTALRRIRTGDFEIANAITLADFAALDIAARFDKLLAVDACVHSLPSLVLDASQSKRIRQGQRLNVKATMLTQQLNLTANQMFRLFDDQQQFLGTGLLEPNGRLQPMKLVNLNQPQ